MKTLRLTDIDHAAAILSQGGVLAFPTETVFGLGVDATNPNAVEKLFAAKGRPSDNPLIVHVGSIKHWPLAAAELTPSAAILLKHFSPGPITVIVPKHPSISPAVTAGLDTVGLRIPNHPIAQAILTKANRPIAAPSANRSGRPSGTTWQSVLEDLDGLIDAIFVGQSPGIGLESTVVDCVHEPPTILRPGAISLEMIRSVIPAATAGLTTDSAMTVRSPGTLHPHYQPKAEVCLVTTADEFQSTRESTVYRDHSSDGPKDTLPPEKIAYCGLETIANQESLGAYSHFATAEEYARHLYEFLREADRRGVSKIFCQLVPPSGIGEALNDRLRRAAGRG